MQRWFGGGGHGGSGGRVGSGGHGGCLGSCIGYYVTGQFGPIHFRLSFCFIALARET